MNGEINYKYILHLLEDIGYDGFIGLEYKPRGKNTGLAQLENYLNIEGFLEKYLKIKSALKKMIYKWTIDYLIFGSSLL